MKLPDLVRKVLKLISVHWLRVLLFIEGVAFAAYGLAWLGISFMRLIDGRSTGLLSWAVPTGIFVAGVVAVITSLFVVIEDKEEKSPGGD